MKAIFFGSIGSVVETSELQRKSFNDAFAEAGLNWHWDQASYRAMLRSAGGRQRIEDYARQRGEAVDAVALHARKSQLFQQALAQGGVSLRAGVAETLAQAKDAGLALGFVTSTERATVEIIAGRVKDITSIDFDVMTWRLDNLPGKPDPAVYTWALDALDLRPQDVVAIEDNRDGVLAAKAAALFTIGFPGENTQASELHAADVIGAPLQHLIGQRMAAKTEAAA
ncbi:MAG: HAD-IA family hydrolase [Pseudomonadota bacterium]